MFFYVNTFLIFLRFARNHPQCIDWVQKDFGCLRGIHKLDRRKKQRSNGEEYVIKQ